MSNAKIIDGFEMMLVNAGTFTMGANDDSDLDNYDPMADSDESPAHQVTLTHDYYLGVYPVTQKQWMDIMGDNPSKYQESKYAKGDIQRPVENVSFIDVQNFIAKLNAKTGKKFRLPTEAEWEYAARGGPQSKGYKYAGDADVDNVAWHRSNSTEKMKTTTKAVGKKAPNEIGIYDMSGNVAEWVNDRDGTYEEEAVTDPAGPEAVASAAYDIRITRGGSIGVSGNDCRVSSRNPQEVNVKEDSLGFRLALTSDTQSPAAARPAAGGKQAATKTGPNPAVEKLKSEVKEYLTVAYASNAAMVPMMMNGYNSNPAASTAEYWEAIKEAVSGQAEKAKQAQSANAPDSAIEAIKKEVKSRLDITYAANPAVIGIMFNSFNSSPEAGKLEYWQKIRESVGGAAAPVDPKREQRSGDWSYIDDSGKITITRYWGSKYEEEIRIPAQIEGKSVTCIGESAVERVDYASMVTIPDGITEIGESAFHDLKYLRHLTIPDSVVTIGECAFKGCKLISVSFGKGLKTIGKRAFDGNQLTELTIPDNVMLGEDAFDGNFIGFQAAPSVKSKEIDEKSKIIDLSVETPAPCGRGWTFTDGVYTVYDWANVTIKGDNKKSGHRVEVAKGARKVNITLQDVTMFTDTKPISEDTDHRSDGKSPLLFKAPVTLWLKGKNTITTKTDKRNLNGKSFTYAGLAMYCDALIIAGTGDLTVTGTVRCGSSARDADLTVYGGKITVLYGSITAKDFVLNSGEILIGKQNEKEYVKARIYCKAFTVNSGTVTVTNDVSTAIEAETVDVNGGEVTAINKEWAYDSAPPSRPAIKAAGRYNSSSGVCEVEGIVTVRGGTVKATVEKASIAAAIGIDGEDEPNKGLIEEAKKRLETCGKLVMTGGTVRVSQLEGSQKKGYLPSKTNIAGVSGGMLYDGEKSVFKGSSPQPSAPPEFVPDIFEYVDERADYKVIDGFEMIRVKAGTFMMGATKDQGTEAERNEKPAHQVTLTRDYYIGVIHVTQNQWAEIMGFNPSMLQRNIYDLKTQIEWSAILGAKPSRFAGCDFYPVECVSYTNILDFIAKLNKKTGKKFRLPTEAEWEYAARGGIKSRGFMYAGSNNEKEVMTKKTLDMIITPTAVKDCNELGLYDMSGNVNEWISDFMGAYTQSAKTDPTGPNEPADKEYNERVVRGGGRIAVRKEERERGKSSGIGFRLVLSTD